MSCDLSAEEAEKDDGFKMPDLPKGF